LPHGSDLAFQFLQLLGPLDAAVGAFDRRPAALGLDAFHVRVGDVGIKFEGVLHLDGKQIDLHGGGSGGMNELNAAAGEAHHLHLMEGPPVLGGERIKRQWNTRRRTDNENQQADNEAGLHVDGA
jgi:hypothetical protein